MLQTDLKVASERSTSPSDLHVDRSAQGFLTFTVGKTQSFNLFGHDLFRDEGVEKIRVSQDLKNLF